MVSHGIQFYYIITGEIPIMAANNRGVTKHIWGIMKVQHVIVIPVSYTHLTLPTILRV